MKAFIVGCALLSSLSLASCSHDNTTAPSSETTGSNETGGGGNKGGKGPSTASCTSFGSLSYCTVGPTVIATSGSGLVVKVFTSSTDGFSNSFADADSWSIDATPYLPNSGSGFYEYAATSDGVTSTKMKFSQVGADSVRVAPYFAGSGQYVIEVWSGSSLVNSQSNIATTSQFSIFVPAPIAKGQGHRTSSLHLIASVDEGVVDNAPSGACRWTFTGYSNSVAFKFPNGQLATGDRLVVREVNAQSIYPYSDYEVVKMTGDLDSIHVSSGSVL